MNLVAELSSKKSKIKSEVVEMLLIRIGVETGIYLIKSGEKQ